LIYVFLNNFVLRGLKHLANKTSSDIDDSLIGLLHGALKVSIVVITGLFILDSWGIEIGPFLAGLGIAESLLLLRYNQFWETFLEESQ
jgi:small-conductance mechanosensitive channel